MLCCITLSPCLPWHPLGPVPGEGLSWGLRACEYLQVCATWSEAELVPVGVHGTLQSWVGTLFCVLVMRSQTLLLMREGCLWRSIALRPPIAVGVGCAGELGFRLLKMGGRVGFRGTLVVTCGP